MKARIIIESDVPSWAIQGVKEDAAMYFERYGDSRVVSIDEVAEQRYEQIGLQMQETGRVSGR